MNLVIDDAFEVKQATKAAPEETRRPLGEFCISIVHRLGMNTHSSTGQILLKGDNVALIQSMDS